jgi:CubicO group peptidase (beta-lactamase class C family)
MQRLNSSYSRIELAWNLFAIAILTTAFISIDCACAMAAAAAVADESAAVNKLFKEWDKPSSPGCAVAVMKDGRITYQHGYGMADLSHDIKITPDTVFYVGSMSKQFTAMAIFMLAQEGKISLDDPIRKYVPEVPDFGTPITLRKMLTLTSGLRDYEQLLWFDGWRLDSPDELTDGDVLYIVSRQKELNFPPGTDWLYSNTNYELLGQVVSRVSGESLREFTSKRIFEPLDMMHTWFRVSHGDVIRDLATPYEEDRGDFFVSIPNYDTVGATNVVTTVGDLAKWDHNLYTGAVGGPALVRQLLEPGKLNDGTPLIYGNGWFVNTLGGLSLEGTGGAGDAGYIVDMTRFPEQRLSMAVLCNLAGIDPEDLANKVGDIYLNGKVSAAIAASKGPPATTAQITPEQASKYAGTYIAPGGNYVLRIEQRPGGLWAHWFWGPSSIDSELEALSEKRFRFPNVGEIDVGDDGNVRMIEKSSGARLRPRSVPYTRVPQFKANAADLREFAGEYSSEEIYVPYYVTLASDGLVLHPPKMPPSTLSPLTKDVFFCDGMRLRFTRDTKGDVSGFLMSGRWNRVQNVKFERAARP